VRPVVNRQTKSLPQVALTVTANSQSWLTQEYSLRCSEYSDVRLVCDDAEPTVNDTFKDVVQCSDTSKEFVV
jgi:hypothetical protein